MSDTTRQPGCRITVVIEGDYTPGSLRDVHGELRRWFEARGAKVIKTTTGAVCPVCWGDGYTIPEGQGCIVTVHDACTACDGDGRWKPEGRP